MAVFSTPSLFKDVLHTFRRGGTQPVAQAVDVVSAHPAVDTDGNNDVDSQLGLLLARGGFRGIWNNRHATQR